MINTTLYASNKKGQIKFITIQSEGPGIITISGPLHCDNPKTDFIEVKDLCNSNGILPAKQHAIFKCNHIIEKLLKTDYYESIDLALTQSKF